MYAYQSLEAWKRAHAAAVLLLRLTGLVNHPRTFAIFDQSRRAAISVAANIVEGYALATPALYRKHLRIALGSAAEAEYLVRLAGELEYLPRADVRQAEDLLGGAMRALRGLLSRPAGAMGQRPLQQAHAPRTTPHAVHA